MALSLPPGNSKFDPTAAIPNGPFYSPLVSTIQGPWYPMVVGAGLNVDYADSVISGGGGPSGGVTLVNTGTGLTGGPITSTGTVSMANTTVTPGSYTLANITVDAQGRITAASNGTVVTVPAATPVVLGAILGCTTLVKTSVGCNSLVANSSGDKNSAFGLCSLAGNTSGSYNTAVGFESLKGNVGGSNNSALGSSALAVNAGSGNSAFGSDSLTANSSGVCNSAFGFAALSNTTTGCLNTATGACSLHSNIGGLCNVADGYRSLCAVTTGCLNVGVGFASGSAITTESCNSVLGSITGQAGCSGHIYLGNGDGSVLGLRVNELGAWSPYNSGAGLNTPSYGTAGQVLVSCGASASPQWTSTPTITVPAATPTVVGTVLGCTTANNTGLGCNSLLVNTGSFNSALGDSALEANTSGSYNTAIGGGSFSSVTTGNNNIGIGYLAGCALTTEDGNAVIGGVTGEAGCSNQIFLANGAGSVIGLRVNAAGAWSPYNTGGNLNTPAYGTAGQVLVSCGNAAAPQWATAPAGAAATPITLGSVLGCTVANNTSVGCNALNALTTGCLNAVIGVNAAPLLTTGACNAVVGHRALASGLSVRGNVALGYQSLYNATSNNNVAVGTCALFSSTFGYSNVAVGSEAGSSISDGAQNTIIGDSAGSNITTGSCNIVIGQRASVADGTACCQLVIGNFSDNWLTGDSTKAIKPGAGIIDCANSTGTAGQVLMSNGANALCWGPAPSGPTATPIALGTVYGCTVANCTSLGLNALAANTGSFNTAVGNNAMQANTTGCRNTAVGHLAIACSDVGRENTAIGFCSGMCLSGISCRNVFVGSLAGSLSTDGESNIGIGHLAVCRASGSGNVAIGDSSGRRITTGSANVLVGKSTGNSLTTGCLNVAVGESALISSTTGRLNIAMGYYSLGCLTTGEGNTVIGPSISGECLTTESWNVVIGGSLAADLVGCDNHILLSDGCGCTRVVWDNGGAMAPGGGGSYGTPGQILTSGGPGALPVWCSLSIPTATPESFGIILGRTGAGCTALGCNALLNNTGANNVAIGENALCLNTTGCYNTAVGYNAMCGNTVGEYNTALGLGALSVGDQFDNVAIGYCAAVGTSVNTGRSVVIGVCAGKQGAGFDNVVIGYDAACGLTGAIQNSVVIGSCAGENLSSGGSNVFVGRNSGCNVSSGACNLVLGTNTGRSLTTGCFNTVIGHEVSCLGLESGCRNILLGSTRCAAGCLVGTENDNVIIGNSNALSIRGCSGHVLISSGAESPGERVMAVWNNCAALDPGGIANYGAVGQVLTSQGPTAPPIWAAQAGGGAATPTTVGTVFGYTGSAAGSGVSLGCCALGNPSLAACGIGNVGIGYFAGYNVGSCGTSNYNTAVGNYALGQDAPFPTGSLRGSGNTALGFSAGMTKNTAATAASNCNTYIGFIAGGGSNYGVNCNTFVGAFAGYPAGNATGVNNTTIGYCAQTSTISSSNEIVLGNTSNNIIRAAVNSITTLSDGRDKSNVSDLPVGLEFINSLHPVKFTWQHRDPNPVRDGSLDSGFIAQEVQKAQEDYNASEYLGLVHDENPEKLEVTPGKLIPVLVKAIQELSAKNAELEARLAKLESTN